VLNADRMELLNLAQHRLFPVVGAHPDYKRAASLSMKDNQGQATIIVVNYM